MRTPTWRVALDQFTAELRGLYGSRLDAVILYGSRARGDADEASDVDTLILLDPCADFWTEFERVSPIASRISLEHDVVISALPADRRAFEKAGSPLFLNAHREGIRVA